jgi:RHS repeat-associated protein
VNYAYDALNRLASAAATGGAGWSQTYTYDGFGNLGAAADLATNRSTGSQYDANGNPQSVDGWPVYDVENRPIQYGPTGGKQWQYDPSGKRVLWLVPRNNGQPTSHATCEFTLYGITGQRLSTYSCSFADQDNGDGTFAHQLLSRNLYFGGKLIRSNGVTVATDRLGSVRATANGERMSYYPYGIERTQTPDGREKFGTYFRDELGDYADQRTYQAGSGRFLTPDPVKAGDPADPASWNKYSYVQGDPINFVDPSGLESEGPGETCVINGITYPYACSDLVTAFGRNGSPGGSLPAAIKRLNAYTIAVNAMDAITNSKLDRPECQADLEKLGVTADQIHDVTRTQGVLDGTVSSSKVATVSTQTPDFAGQTVASFFASREGDTTTLAGNRVHSLYIDPNDWSRKTGEVAFGTVLHEAMHFLGLTDPMIGDRLVGFSSQSTSLYSTILTKDCF